MSILENSLSISFSLSWQIPQSEHYGSPGQNELHSTMWLSLFQSHLYQIMLTWPTKSKPWRWLPYSKLVDNRISGFKRLSVLRQWVAALLRWDYYFHCLQDTISHPSIPLSNYYLAYFERVMCCPCHELSEDTQ